MDSISRELHSLKTVLEMLSEDTRGQEVLPTSLGRQITATLTNCSVVVNEIEVMLEKYSTGDMKKITR